MLKCYSILVQHILSSLIVCLEIKYDTQDFDFELSIDTPSGHVMCTDKVYKSCDVLVSGRELEANLVLLDMYEFDVILGMDWLSIFHASIDCFGKKVCLEFLVKLNLYLKEIVW
jgi:hypothetical protein